MTFNETLRLDKVSFFNKMSKKVKIQGIIENANTIGFIHSFLHSYSQC